MCIILDIRTEGESLRLFAQRQIERTVTHFEEKKVNFIEVSDICQKFMGLFDKAIRSGGQIEERLELFQNLGLNLYDLLFTQRIKDKLQQAEDQHLILRIDESLVYIPWELLYDGKNFLSLYTGLGRKVYTRLEGIEPHHNKITLPLKILVIADPRNDLESAYQEGISIMEMLNPMRDRVAVDFKSTTITPQMLKLCIRDYDIVHYAGHAEYNLSNPLQSGWLMAEGSFTAEDIMAMSNINKPMPALIFSNACQSGRSIWKIDERSNQQIFSMANAFLLSGVTHYIGTCRDILDEHSGYFAQTFYQNLIMGDSIGRAVQKARLGIRQKFGKNSVFWASYLLYGDPSTRYLPGETTHQKEVGPELRKTKEKKEPTVPSKSLFKWLVFFVFGIVAIVIIKLLFPKPEKTPAQQSQQAITSETTKNLSKKPNLIIQSIPSEASVFYKQKILGTTPLQKYLPPGNYQLSIQKYGYQSLGRSINLDDKDIKLEFTLIPLPNWPMFRFDPSHSAGQGEKLIPPLKLKWKFTAGGRVRAGAALVSNTLYIGAEDNYLYALNAESGKLLWKCRTGGHISSEPTVVGNIVYITSADGSLYAIDSKNNGKIIWQENLKSTRISSPAVCLADGRLYVGTSSGRIYQLDLTKSSDRIIDSFATRGNISSVPIIYKRKAYIGSGDGGLYCLDNEHFKKICQTAGSITAPPLIKDGVVYVASEDEHLYAFSVEGRLSWKCNVIKGEIVASPVLTEDKLFLGTVDAYFYSVNASDGHVLWNQKLGGPIFSPPVISEGFIYVGCDDGYLYALQTEDGTIVWKYFIGEKIRSAPILIAGTIYLGADNHNIYALTNK